MFRFEKRNQYKIIASLFLTMLINNPAKSSEDLVSSKKNLSTKLHTINILSLDCTESGDVAQLDLLDKVSQKTGLAVWEMFDMIGGVSYSALASVALSNPSFYGDGLVIGHLKEDFSKKHNHQKADAIAEMASTRFGDSTFDQSKTDTIVFTYNLDGGNLETFKSWDRNHKFPNSQIAQALTACPTYTDSFGVYGTTDSKNQAKGYFALSDAKTLIKNPAALILQAAYERYPDCQYNIISLSSGTVNPDRSLWDQAEAVNVFLTMRSDKKHTFYMRCDLTKPIKDSQLSLLVERLTRK